MSDKPKQRIAWIDVAKGIAMIGIMLGHIPFKNGDDGSLFVPYVAQFDVPLFFILAGVFMGTRKRMGPFVAQKAFRLLMPYALTCVVIGLVIALFKFVPWPLPFPQPWKWKGLKDLLTASLWGASLNLKTLPDGVSYIGAIWFLEALFVATIEVQILINRLSDRPFIGALVAALLSVLAIRTHNHFYIPGNVQQGLVGGMYVYSGYLFRRYIGLEKRAHFDTVIILLLAFFLSARFGFAPWIHEPALPHGLLALSVSFCACRLVMELSYQVDQRLPKTSAMLSFIGKNSLIVLCVHLICLDCGFRMVVEWLLGLTGVPIPTNLVCSVNMLAQLGLSAVTVIAIQHTRYLKRVFY